FIQEQIMQYANSKRIKRLILQKGDKVYLLRKNIKTIKLSNKLNYSFRFGSMLNILLLMLLLL
ncbi:hypothetical protein M406DRAFT_269091, partial [Cryphonectria parasitica EP155]